ncbi:MAG: envelope stress response membrane protein PspC [Desulfobacterales bacterium]|nr:envelope stress response membrane protein PspC [Desulfobacterales bacterium]MDJ0876606.1 envelope stress response membrane protein PspC [Desulfobacterales bacterium]
MRDINSRLRRGLYRSRQGAFLGVCRGLAEYFDLSVTWIRIFVVLVLLATGIWPVLGIYLVAALIMKPEPVRPFKTADEREFYDSYATSRESAAQRIKRRYGSLERRIRRLEDTVTSREFDWQRRMNS